MNNLTLFELGQDLLEGMLKKLATYNIYAGSQLRLCQADSILCFYNFQEKVIYLGLPDLTDKAKLFLFRSLFSPHNPHEIISFYRLILPYFIAHELGHHLRHHYQVVSDDLWHEEQVANQFATAMTNFSPEDRVVACRFLEPVIAALKRVLGIQLPLANDIYYDIWAVIHTLPISSNNLKQLKIFSCLFDISPLELITQSKLDSVDINDRLAQRPHLINQMNEEFKNNFLFMVYYQLSWLHISLITHEKIYLDKFAYEHLGFSRYLLPIPSNTIPITETTLKAMFKAYQDTLPLSKVVASYFYKRYRSLLLAYLQIADFPQVKTLYRETNFLLQTWHDQFDELDILSHLTFLLPPHLHTILPNHIAMHLPADFPLLLQLPTETDQRFWQYIMTQTADLATANTLTYLTILNQLELFRGLPAEALLELTYLFCTIKLGVGNTVMWQGDLNSDIYILTQGELTVWVSQEAQEKELATIGDITVWVNQEAQEKQIGNVQVGEVLGEMEFFTHQPCHATVRATVTSECLVLKSIDLTRLAYKYPGIFQLAGITLANRLAKMNQNLF